VTYSIVSSQILTKLNYFENILHIKYIFPLLQAFDATAIPQCTWCKIEI